MTIETAEGAADPVSSSVTPRPKHRKSNTSRGSERVAVGVNAPHLTRPSQNYQLTPQDHQAVHELGESIEITAYQRKSRGRIAVEVIVPIVANAEQCVAIFIGKNTDSHPSQISSRLWRNG